jgi:hypothetical protein
MSTGATEGSMGVQVGVQILHKYLKGINSDTKLPPPLPGQYDRYVQVCKKIRETDTSLTKQ